MLLPRLPVDIVLRSHSYQLTRYESGIRPLPLEMQSPRISWFKFDLITLDESPGLRWLKLMLLQLI
jgi:hypothetical protein